MDTMAIDPSEFETGSTSDMHPSMRYAFEEQQGSSFRSVEDRIIILVAIVLMMLLIFLVIGWALL